MKNLRTTFASLLCGVLLTNPGGATPDLWIRDDATDTGAEPNISSPIIYLSDDIWIRTTPDPNYDPTPFPVASPTWTPQPHQNPCYRNPRTSSPNYMYIRIRNRGNTPSLGTETLHAYWAKASTGLNWSSDWNDHVASPCGLQRLYGYEITKPRKNGATASITEKNRYVAATQAIDSSFLFPDGVSYFDKQNIIHLEVTSVSGGGTGLQPAHNNIRFLSWHREMISRYEALLQEADPLVTLLYWNWNASPVGTITGTGGYMGASNGVVGAPFAGWGITRSTVGAPFSNMTAAYEASTVLTQSSFGTFRPTLEGPHNSSHGYIGGTTSFTNLGARDPFFFHIHTNVDRLWSKWQRQQLARWRPSTAYDVTSTNPIDSNLAVDLEPWAGTPNISPWQNQVAGDPNGYQIFKKSTSRSLIFPPIYDDAPLTVPILAAGQACIIEIPFYPPPSNECPSFSDPQHLCLLARVETAPEPGFGMASIETGNLGLNVKNNNNIAWKNTSLDDCDTGPFLALMSPRGVGAIGQLVQAVDRRKDAILRLNFRQPENLNPYGQTILNLDETLFKAWDRGGKESNGLIQVGPRQFAINGQGNAQLHNVILLAGEIGHYDIGFDPAPNYQHPEGQVFLVTTDQYELNPTRGAYDFVGGQGHVMDFNRLTMIHKDDEWHVLDDGTAPTAWPPVALPAWPAKPAPFSTTPSEYETKIRFPGNQNAAYFVNEFNVIDPGEVRNIRFNVQVDDGVAIYLNGALVYSDNLPPPPWTNATPASTARKDFYATVCRPVNIPTDKLVPGKNIIGVEVHRALGDGASFGLELALNALPLTREPVQTGVVTDRSVYPAGEPISIELQTLVPDADTPYTRALLIEGVRYELDPNGRTIVFLPPGTHRITGITTDATGEYRALKVIQVVPNLPPTIAIVGGVHADGDIHIHTVASDPPDGEVAEVSFFAKSHDRFDSPIVVLGRSTIPPFAFTVLPFTEPGEFMVWAEAKDKGGLVTGSNMIHIVNPGEVTPGVLKIEKDPSFANQLRLDWDLPGSNLEESDNLIDWFLIRNAVSPYFVPSTGGGRKFFRAANPDGVSIHNHSIHNH